MKKILGFIVIAVFALVAFTTGVEATDVTITDTLQSKIDAATTGSTIVLDKNYAENIVIEGKSINLDLNGCTITNSANENGHTITVALNAELLIYGQGEIANNIEGNYAAIFNNGKATIQDATIRKNNKTYYNIVNHGEMEISSGKVINETPYSGNLDDQHASLIENGYYSYENSDPILGYVEGINKKNPSLTIEGGEFNGGRNTVKNDDGGILVVKDGIFKNNIQVAIYNFHIATINGGTFAVPLGEDKTTVLNWNYNDEYATGKLTINEGTFTADYFIETANEKGAVSINGGTFNTNKGIENPYKKDGVTPRADIDLNISGGTFNQVVNANDMVEGYVCKEIDNKYVVGKIYTITVGNVENGIVTINRAEVTTGQKIEVLAGQEVEIQPVPKEGYRLEGISGVEGLEDVAEYAYIFVMPEKDITLTPVLTKLTQEVEVPSEVANSEKIKEILLEELKENEDFAELIKNNNVKVIVEVKEKEVVASEKEDIEEAANKKAEGIKVAKYLDISINITTEDGTFVDNLEELKKEITFKIKIPTDLPKLEEGYTRTYYIVRNHNGKIEFLDTKVSGDELEFSSKLFSTYAIAYSDAKIVETPSGDATGTPSGDATGTPSGSSTGTPSGSSTGTPSGDATGTSSEKDESPKMGSIDVVLYASALVATISLAGIVMVKKYTK